MAWNSNLLTKRGMVYPPLFLFLLATSMLAGTSTYKLDFGTATSPLADGFQVGEAPSLQSTCDPCFDVTDEKGGNPVTISFTGAIGAYSLGNAEKPLTTDGIYTFENKPDEPTNIEFTISCLPVGSLVTFYGMNAWNGDGRAAYLSFGDSGMVDLAGSTEPQAGATNFDAFILVAAKQKVGADGKLTGVFSNSDGSKSRAEGQWGGLVLVVETP
ncbi:MAG: hypothetical protein ACOYM3_05235 [Terrimicrobiaceae bacterium]